MARKKKPTGTSKKDAEQPETGSVKDAAESIEDAVEATSEDLDDAVTGADEVLEPDGPISEPDAPMDDAATNDAEAQPADEVESEVTDPEPEADVADAASEEQVAEPDQDPLPSEEEVAALDATETEPQEETPVPPPPQMAEQASRAGFVPLLLGGLVAGALGFFGGRYYDDWAARDYEGPTVSGNAAAVASVQEQLDGLSSSLEALSARDFAAEAQDRIDAAVSPLAVQGTETSTRMDGLEGALSQLSERIETIALRPTATGIEADEFDSALAEFREQLQSTIAQAQSEIDKARGEAEKISDQAFAAEQSALVKSAWSQIETALESGASFTEPLEELKGVSQIEIPPVLEGAAEAGIVTLAKLQQDFPSAARAALNDAQRAAPSEDSGVGRIASFLKVQSGMRSLAPREGDDPDAVLSRAEAALRDGDVLAALAEIEALPDEGRTALQSWLSAAQTRLDVLAAADQIAENM